jgi:Bacterial protein of unknown function (DUF894).
VSLNSAVMTGTRIVGPALAGALIAGIGLSWCFFLNAVSYIAVIAALLSMHTEELRNAACAPGGRRDPRGVPLRVAHRRAPPAADPDVGAVPVQLQLFRA